MTNDSVNDNVTIHQENQESKEKRRQDWERHVREWLHTSPYGREYSEEDYKFMNSLADENDHKVREEKIRAYFLDPKRVKQVIEEAK